MGSAQGGLGTQQVNAHNIADEVFKAFNELAAHSGNVIERFEQAFNERAKVPELCEAEGGSNGLTSVLAGLLRRSPPESYLNLGWSDGTYKNESFKRDFRVALDSVADRYPETLLLIYRHKQQKNCTLKQVLRGLLLRYADHKAAYPF